MTESIFTRVKSIAIGTANSTNNYTTWTGIKLVRDRDTDPWIHINIPQGEMIHQHIKSPHFEIEVECYDYTSLKGALYTQVIDDANHTAIYTTGGVYQKWKINYMVVNITDQAGTAHTVTLTGARVITREAPVEVGKEGLWIVKFTADRSDYS
jgi:hypothetical protein